MKRHSPDAGVVAAQRADELLDAADRGVALAALGAPSYPSIQSSHQRTISFIAQPEPNVPRDSETERVAIAFRNQSIDRVSVEVRIRTT